GRSRLLPGSSMAGLRRVRLHALLELLAGAEGDHGAGGDRDLLPGLGVAAVALVLAPHVEVAEAGELHLPPLLQGLAQHLKEGIDEFLRLALVQANLFVQPLGHLCLRQCHGPCFLNRGYVRRGPAAAMRSPAPPPLPRRDLSGCAICPAESSP